LVLAEQLDWDCALVLVDDPFDDDEVRMIAPAPNTGTLYYVAFVDRAEVDALNWKTLNSWYRCVIAQRYWVFLDQPVTAGKRAWMAC
jgi:hypothetical protein